MWTVWDPTDRLPMTAKATNEADYVALLGPPPAKGARKCECCQKRGPMYNFPGYKGRRCKGCLIVGMINVKTRKCAGCGVKQPHYGIPGEGATHCKGCSLDGMMYIGKMCQTCKKRQPNFGPEGSRPTHCSECALPGMVNPYMRKCLDCRAKSASFGLETDGVVRFCATCAREHPGTMNLCCNYCRGEHHPPGASFRVAVTAKTGYLCLDCRMLEGKRHAKEAAIGEVLLAGGLVPTHSNMAIGGNLCSEKKPDFVFYSESGGVVIVEVDEEEHETYPARCETVRMLEIWLTLGLVATTFIRYNPDGCHRNYRTSEMQRDLVDLTRRCLIEQGIEDGLHVHYIGYSAEREAECRISFEAEKATLISTGWVMPASRKWVKRPREPDADMLLDEPSIKRANVQ